MKKLLFMLAVALLGSQLSGQAQARVGLSAGVSMANMEGVQNGNTKGGVIAGIVMDVSCKKMFSFRPSLTYVQKGTIVPEPTLLIEKRSTALRYIEFSPDFVYNVNGAKGGAFYIGLGPSIAFDLPSKRVDMPKDDTQPKTTTIIHFGKESTMDLKGFDYGVDFTTGYRVSKGFFINLNFNMGLRDLAVEGQTKELKNRYFGIQLGYFLENGKKK